MLPCAGVINVFAPSQNGYQAAEARILDLTGESVKARLAAAKNAVMPILPQYQSHLLPFASCVSNLCAPAHHHLRRGGLQEGAVYRGTVTRLMDFGAMVELEPSGLRALLHISEVSAQRVRSIDDVLQVRESCGRLNAELIVAGLDWPLAGIACLHRTLRHFYVPVPCNAAADRTAGGGDVRGP